MGRRGRNNLGKRIVGKAILILVVLALSGCATSTVDLSQYVRDGVQYGDTEGRFRGRWWNYYERGRSFADGAYWAEAEKDLRTALIGRDRDQLWPRTYGLHFIPEYFPHRELGIVLYHQGRLEEAIDELETSWDQRKSARVAYFLDEARQAQLAALGLDLPPPTVVIHSPTASDVIAEMSVEVVGMARGEAFVKTITIGEESVPIELSGKELEFSQEISLAPGQNEIKVAVTDLAGKTTETVLQTRSDVDGPALSFDEPLVLPGRITGVAYDRAGVSAVRIGAKTAQLTPTDEGLVAFSVELAREDLKAPVEYEGEDERGNVTRGRLPESSLRTVLLLDHVNPVVFAGNAIQFVPLTETVRGVFLGGQLVALAAVPVSEQAGPEVRFPNLSEGQKYFMDDIVVGVDIDSPSPITRVELNGVGLEMIPNRKVQRLSRRIRLAKGSNPIRASAEDAEGLYAEASVSVERELTEVEQISSRLKVAMLGNIWKGNSPRFENEARIIIDQLERELRFYHERFTFVNRDLLAEAMRELQISADLGSRTERLELGKVVAAELLFVGKVRRDADSFEIIVEAESTETTVVVARAEIAGRADSRDDLTRLVKNLALGIVQEFPRVRGLVARVPASNRITTNIGAVHRVNEYMKYLVFRQVEIPDPSTDGILGYETEVIAEALVRSVQPTLSTAEVLLEEGEEPPLIEVGSHVATK